MDIVSILWDLDEEPDGNVQHVAEHGLSKEEAESVLLNPDNEVDESHSSGLPVTFGLTFTGRHIIVIWENVLDDPKTVYGKRVQKKTEWTAEDRERRRKVRELFKHKPTIDELVAQGELSGNTVPMGLYLEMQQLLHDLKEAREAAGLSLADISERTGMDKAVLSKMENGRHGVPTLTSLARYAQALGRKVALSLTPETAAATKK